MNEADKQVAEFHRTADMPVLTTPEIPSDDRIRLRLKLVLEEAFELAEASTLSVVREALSNMKNAALSLIEVAGIDVDLEKFVDSCADLDYVVAGSRLEVGVDGTPFADEVHRANMAKFGPSSWKREDGKQMKPPGWQPPDILSILKAQGWKGYEWVIFENPDRTQFGLTKKSLYDKQKFLQVDTDDRPMSVVKTFRAYTYDEAKEEYERCLKERIFSSG